MYVCDMHPSYHRSRGTIPNKGCGKMASQQIGKVQRKEFCHVSYISGSFAFTAKGQELCCHREFFQVYL